MRSCLSVPQSTRSAQSTWPNPPLSNNRRFNSKNGGQAAAEASHLGDNRIPGVDLGDTIIPSTARRRSYSTAASRNCSAAASGLMVFTDNPEPNSKPVGMLVRGQISRCQ